MKLEPKHIIPYLEHKLKCVCTSKIIDKYDTKNKIFELDSIELNSRWKYWTHDKDFVNQLNCQGKGFTGGQIKLILKPISDLKVSKSLFGEYNCNYPEEFKDSILGGYVEYIYMVELFKGHHDVFGLIKEGLAIDINTITCTNEGAG